MEFPCIYLPRPPSFTAEDYKKSHEEGNRVVHDFVLWGLTLGMISDMMKLTGLPGITYSSFLVRHARTIMAIHTNIKPIFIVSIACWIAAIVYARL